MGSQAKRMILRAGQLAVWIVLFAATISGCKSAPSDSVSVSPTVEFRPASITPAGAFTPGSTVALSSPASPTATHPLDEITPAPVSRTAAPTLTSTRLSSPVVLQGYDFPESIDPMNHYLFYLHGRIIEDQGLPAISPDFGEYEYLAILEKLANYGFVVISEPRRQGTDWEEYARLIVDQANTLLDAGVPAANITVVGASKGAGIAVYVSHYLEVEQINYVIMAICHPDVVEAFIKQGVYLYGNVLSIYDSVDEYAGSCRDLFEYSEGRGLSRYDEIVLSMGQGHGILYRPLDEWVIPAVQWPGQ